MTFTEAAIEVLRREGKPLHFKKIAEIAIRESLLDHVGKIPDEVMAGQLATQCRLPFADRKVAVVQAGTFALSEWGLDEDPAGLDNLVEPPPADEPPYRGNERHPTPSRELVRASGRGEGREGRGEGRGRRREEGEEQRGRRYPPPAEVAYEILAGAGRGLPLTEIAAQGAERFLMPDVFVRESAALAAALLEDNRRRESAGRRPLFALEGEEVTLAAQPEPGERATAPLTASRQPLSAADLRKSALMALRRRLAACDAPTLEHVAVKLLQAMELSELKVAKRGRDHVVYTGRRKLGVAEVRHCVRLLRTDAEPSRHDVSDLRRDVGNYGAQIGILVGAGEAGREARAEAGTAGQVPVLLYAGEGLAEALAACAVGCKQVVVPEVDEAFFAAATEGAQVEEAARRARREERDRRDGRDERGPRRDGPERRPRREGAGERVRGEAAHEPGPREISVEREQETPGALQEVDASPPESADTFADTFEEQGGDGWSLVPDAPVASGGAAVEAGAGSSGAADLEGGPASIPADEDEEGPDEGDGEEGEERASPSSPAGAPLPEGERGSAEGSRRRRRRRRRGGRGRGREPGAPAEGAAPAGEGGASSSARAAGPAAPAVEVREAPPSGTGEPASGGGERGGEG